MRGKYVENVTFTQPQYILTYSSLNKQIRLDCCRLCLKLDYSDAIATNCGGQIVVEQTVNDLLSTTFGIVLSESDQAKGICRECLARLEIVENTFNYFSKKNQRWRQMQELILEEDTHWLGNNESLDNEEQVSFQHVCTIKTD